VQRSWLPISSDSDFSLENIPFGIFRSAADPSPRTATRIGDTVVDLARLAEQGLFDSVPGFDRSALSGPVLNAFIALGKSVTGAVRRRIQELFREECPDLRDAADLRGRACLPADRAEMLLPIEIGDYTDFYSSREHATNVGTMFRDPANALLPNWLHLPVGYHGRASSIVVSGTPLHRPYGQTEPTPETNGRPGFGPSRQVDFELEMAFVIGRSTELGGRISVDRAEEHIFGMMVFNDWSARDLQKWEYVPLGPFLAKNFGSSVSPWIVTLEALEPFRTEGPRQADPEPLPYLQGPAKSTFDIALEVDIRPENAPATTVCRSNFRYLYWSMAQQLAHHTINGCNVRVGDLMASGTISGPTADSYGSMLELAWKGTRPVPMADGTERRFILDRDTVTMRAFAQKDGLRVGFGEVTCQILPALPQ
jgi:fumarylacetoacetase